ncbi:MAG: hypothetical protein CFE39_00565 [Comamonadaceae bacterium PBBC2]|nr:MAG: hypothetical protein CFE39_00565 [Comamonadaceae bacterium PBBC2]
MADAAAAAKLTLTGLYNVLEALCAGRPLNAKEKIIHTEGLVGVLKDLHDELDAAVLEAYGWSDLGNGAADTPELLTRLLALNTRRAAEEKAGTVRWLRPEFQNPASQANAASLSKEELLPHIPSALQADLALNSPEEDELVPVVKAGKTKTASVAADAQAWPANLPDQVRAVVAVLVAAGAAMPLTAIEASFKGRGPWKKSLPRILETLEALGRARREGEAWRA